MTAAESAGALLKPETIALWIARNARARRAYRGALIIASVAGQGTHLTASAPGRHAYRGAKQHDLRLILCVDDHPVVLDGLSSIIAMQPEMELAATAANGERALKAFREHKPDVTIVDLRLPDMSGFELIKAVRKLDSRARIIVLSSNNGDADIQRALDAGAQAYLAKAWCVTSC